MSTEPARLEQTDESSGQTEPHLRLVKPQKRSGRRYLYLALGLLGAHQALGWLINLWFVAALVSGKLSGAPLELMAINPRREFLPVVASRSALLPFLIVISARLCLVDPLSYWIGRIIRLWRESNDQTEVNWASQRLRTLTTRAEAKRGPKWLMRRVASERADLVLLACWATHWPHVLVGMRGRPGRLVAAINIVRTLLGVLTIYYLGSAVVTPVYGWLGQYAPFI